jgi:hypothetical protein
MKNGLLGVGSRFKVDGLSDSESILLKSTLFSTSTFIAREERGIY